MSFLCIFQCIRHAFSTSPYLLHGLLALQCCHDTLQGGSKHGHAANHHVLKGLCAPVLGPLLPQAVPLLHCILNQCQAIDGLYLPRRRLQWSRPALLQSLLELKHVCHGGQRGNGRMRGVRLPQTTLSVISTDNNLGPGLCRTPSPQTQGQRKCGQPAC